MSKPVLIGQYVVTGVLGSGSFATVSVCDAVRSRRAR